MSGDEVVDRVARSTRYRDVDTALVRRLADEELRSGGRPDEVAKRVKRRLHQALGAFGGARRIDRTRAGLRAAWDGDLASPRFRDACRSALAGHASTRERVPHLDTYYAAIWGARGGAPGSVLDLGCGLAPLALPWMGLDRGAIYHAYDADAGAVALVDGFLALVGQPHSARAVDLVAQPALPAADAALLLKLVPTLDRQAAGAAAALVRGLDVRHAVVSFPRRSLGGRDRGMERTYRERLTELIGEIGRVEHVAEASVANELVFVLELRRG